MAKAKRADGLIKKSFRFNGKRIYIYGRNQEALFEAEKRKREELIKGFEKRDNPTVSQYYDRWNSRRAGKVSEASIRGQNNLFNSASKIFIPSARRVFGDLRLKEVAIDDLLIVQKTLAEKRATRGVNDTMHHLAHVFKDATNERILDYNPFVLLEPLKRTEPPARNTYHRALTKEEQKKFFDSDIVKNSFYYNIFCIAILTGMRIGEIGALKYSDIKDGFICVERTITRTLDGGYKIGDSAKTEAGKRKIPINDSVSVVITRQKQLNNLLDNGIRSTDDLLFRAYRRGLLKPSPVDRELGRICKVLNIDHFTVHAFRDTFATRAIESGIAPKTLQEIMGHSDIGMTLNLYAHVMDDSKKEAMDKISIAI